MSECYSKIFIENGKLRERSEFINLKVFEGLVFYEVLRIREGIPLFLYDHYERLKNSILINNRELLLNYEKVMYYCLSLIRDTMITDGNIKIVFNYSEPTITWLIYYVDAHYPDRELYRKGVKGILYHAERQNPVAKVFNHKLRSSIYSRLIHYNAYEALLVNRDNCITEGSRSNIFFIIDNIFITAPDNCVLGGITRKKILGICREEGFAVQFRCLSIEELKNASSVIMTGTSASLLSFNEIDEFTFNPYNSLLDKVSTLYDELIKKYLKDFK